MTDILDRIATGPRQFRPRSVTDYFALRLATKLRDVEHLGAYLQLLQHHSVSTLAAAFRYAAKQGANEAGTLSSTFLNALSEEHQDDEF